MNNMSDNTKLEVAVEIMANKIAKTLRECHDVNSPELKLLLNERSKMYLGDLEIINKIIEIYGPELNNISDKDNIDTIGNITQKVESASSDFENTNTELKRKYLLWNIEAFKILASKVSVSKGSFGTGYPFYALGENLEGTLPIIPEQIRYNRQLIIDGKRVQKSIWQCKECLKQNYSIMPDLKAVCKPCPNMLDSLKPRKLINRLPDLDMWLICEDGSIKQAQKELATLLEKNNMRTSDVSPLDSIDDVYKISQLLKEGKLPKTFLPIDSHIIEYSRIKTLIEEVPNELNRAKQNSSKPYLPIHPKSYRKEWQYDDEAYNFVYDFLSAFTPLSIHEDLQSSLDKSRLQVSSEHSSQELFDFLLQSATDANFRRFHSPELETYFLKKADSWKSLKGIEQKTSGNKPNFDDDDFVR